MTYFINWKSISLNYHFIKKIMPKKLGIYLSEILNNHIPNPHKSTFWNKGRFIMCPNVIISATIDYSKMADNCYAGIWSCDKVSAKHNKLTREYIDLWPKMAKGGQLVCHKKRWIGKIGIKLFLHKLISQILVKENNDLKNICKHGLSCSKPTRFNYHELMFK